MGGTLEAAYLNRNPYAEEGGRTPSEIEKKKGGIGGRSRLRKNAQQDTSVVGDSKKRCGLEEVRGENSGGKTLENQRRRNACDRSRRTRAGGWDSIGWGFAKTVEEKSKLL